MKRTFKYALTAVLGAAIVAPAFAQDNFPDVPDNHWAYEALARMKRDGLLVGYPDGLFRGGRPASRYELAVAIHATYVHLKNITDSLQSQIDALKGQNLDDIRAAIAGLQNDVNALKGMREDLDNLRKMVDTFQKELQALGVDVEAMKKDLGDLDARVTALEKRKLPVDFSGDVNFWMGAGDAGDYHYTTVDGVRRAVWDNNGFLNKDGRSTDRFGGLTRDAILLHEAALTLAGTNETGPKWRGTIVVGNMLADDQGLSSTGGTGFGSQGNFYGFTGDYNEANPSWYVQDLGIKFDTSLAGLAFNVEAGRVGYKISPYIYQRPDNTTYFANDRWDDGMWRMDGGIIGFNFGGAKLDVFAGRNSRLVNTNGTEVNRMKVGSQLGLGGTVNSFGQPMDIDRSLGANLNIPLGTAGNVNLAYLFLDHDDLFVDGHLVGTFSDIKQYVNRVTVFGGSVNYNVSSLRLEAGASQTNLMRRNDNVVTDDNVAWYGKVSYAQPTWNVFAQYREIGRFFSAPGDWGRLGIFRNPVNIKGFQVGGNLDITQGLNLSANAEFDQGLDDTYGPFGTQATPWDTDSDISKWEVRLGYNITPNFNVGLGYEEDRFQDVGGSNLEPRFRWTTFDLGYGLSEMARLMLKYEYSDHEDVFTGDSHGRWKGGFLTTQLSLKF